MRAVSIFPSTLKFSPQEASKKILNQDILEMRKYVDMDCYVIKCHVGVQILKTDLMLKI